MLSQTGELKLSKEFAVAARWLAMLKRDYPDVFQRGIDVQKFSDGFQKEIGGQKPESKPKSKKVEIELFGDIIFSGDYGMPHKSMASLRILRTDLIFNGIKMAADLLESITGIEPLTPKDANWPEVKMGFALNYHPNDEFSEASRLSALRDYLIQILEEKFGLKIKICGNCENYKRFPDNPFCGHCSLVTIHSVYYNWSCSNITGLGQQWIPKEIPPEKKEKEKTCENCGRRNYHSLSRMGCESILEDIKASKPCDRWIPKKEEEKSCGNCGHFSASLQGRPDIAYECFNDSCIVKEFKTLEEAKKSKPCSIWVPI